MVNLEKSFASRTILKHHLRLVTPNHVKRREPLLCSMVSKPYNQSQQKSKFNNQEVHGPVTVGRGGGGDVHAPKLK